MASFQELKRQLETEQEYQKTIKKEISAFSLRECLEKAKLLLKTENITYEIIEKGNRGFLGFNKKLYKIVASPTTEYAITEELEEVEMDPTTESKTKEPIDGKTKFISRKTGIFLKVSPPTEGGKTVDLKTVQAILEAKRCTKVNPELIKKIVNKHNAKWSKIGDYIPDEEYDSSIQKIEIAEDGLTAYITISSPLFCGRSLEVEEILDYAKANNIIFGIDEEKIKEVIDKELYGSPQPIAFGTKPKNGTNSSIKFLFNIKSEIHLKEDDFGKINFFSDLGIVQNVVAGQILATKNPANEGIRGKMVTGEEIDCIDGEDIDFNAGKNTRIAVNGLEIIAEKQGRAIYENNTFEVEPIYKISGNVGVKTGSIVFLGDVHVTENVEDGFSVKAAGNIYVGGTIGKCEIEADSDIIVQRGIVGKEGGLVKAGKNIFAKFIENSKVKAGNKVVVTDGILHSFVDAQNVYCLGKRGTITGGHIRVTEEVQAKSIGSQSYTETKIEAGIDPEAKEKLIQLEKEKQKLESKLNETSNNITTIQKQMWRKDGLVEKQLTLDKMLKAKAEMNEQLEEINRDIEELRAYLHNISAQGIISAYDIVYPRVEITIKTLTTKINSTNKHVTFIAEGGTIKSIPYQKPKDPEIRNEEEKKGRK